MAAANAQALQNALDNTNLAANQPLYKFIDGKPLIDWNSNGKIRLDAILAAVKAGALDGLTVANGTAAGGPNAGGGAPAAGVAAAYNTASTIIYGKLFGMIKERTALHVTLGQAPYQNNAYLTYELINYEMQMTANLNAAEKQFKSDWDGTTMANSVPLTPTAPLDFKDFVIHLNRRFALPLRDCFAMRAQGRCALAGAYRSNAPVRPR